MNEGRIEELEIVERPHIKEQFEQDIKYLNKGTLIIKDDQQRWAVYKEDLTNPITGRPYQLLKIYLYPAALERKDNVFRTIRQKV